MNSAILRATVRVLVPTLFMFSVLLFLRGHVAPGGGFIAGLTCGAALLLGRGKTLGANAGGSMVALGLLTSTTSGLISGKEFLTGVWSKSGIGSPMLFDFGVALIVVGLMLIFRAEARR